MSIREIVIPLIFTTSENQSSFDIQGTSFAFTDEPQYNIPIIITASHNVFPKDSDSFDEKNTILNTTAVFRFYNNEKIPSYHYLTRNRNRRNNIEWIKANGVDLASIPAYFPKVRDKERGNTYLSKFKPKNVLENHLGSTVKIYGYPLGQHYDFIDREVIFPVDISGIISNFDTNYFIIETDQNNPLNGASGSPIIMVENNEYILVGMAIEQISHSLVKAIYVDAILEIIHSMNMSQIIEIIRPLANGEIQSN